jgi:hypothetical protein
MSKYVVYKTDTLEIVRLSDEEIEFSSLKDDEDFDTVNSWNQVPEGSKKILDFVNSSKD